MAIYRRAKRGKKRMKKGQSIKIKAIKNCPGNICRGFSYFHYGNTWDLEKLKSISKLALKNTASPYQKPPRIFYDKRLSQKPARALLSPMPGIFASSRFPP